MNIAFFGTPELTIPILETLRKSGNTPTLIVTQIDKPVGRKHLVTAPPAKHYGIEHGIPVVQPEKMKDVRDILEAGNFDIFIIAAYGKILPEWLINIPRFGTINIHYSLLPDLRGASPVQSALLRGDTETGVTIQNVVYELDAGDILYQEKVLIDLYDTFDTLLEKLNATACDALPWILEKIYAHTIEKIPQDSTRATFCTKIEKSMGEVFLSEDAFISEKNWNTYRAFYGWPGIFFMDSFGKRVKITKAEFTKDKKFIPIMVIPEGKKEILYSKYIR